MGVLIFLVFVGLSLAGRVMKGQEQRRRTEGQPQRPPKQNETPGQADGSRPRPQHQQWPPTPPPVRPGARYGTPQAEPRTPPPPPRREPVQIGVGQTSGSMETGQMEGIGTGQGISSMMDVGPRASERAQDVKEHSVHGQPKPTPVSLQVADLLNNTDAVTRGIIMAEVLGKPKALRGRGRR